MAKILQPLRRTRSFTYADFQLARISPVNLANSVKQWNLMYSDISRPINIQKMIDIQKLREDSMSVSSSPILNLWLTCDPQPLRRLRQRFCSWAGKALSLRLQWWLIFMISSFSGIVSWGTKRRRSTLLQPLLLQTVFMIIKGVTMKSLRRPVRVKSHAESRRRPVRANIMTQVDTCQGILFSDIDPVKLSDFLRFSHQGQNEGANHSNSPPASGSGPSQPSGQSEKSKGKRKQI